MSDCSPQSSCDPKVAKKRDYLFLLSLILVGGSYGLSFAWPEEQILSNFFQGVYGLVNQMFWGIALALFLVGFVQKIPSEIITTILGTRKGFSGIVRASVAGIVLDLCNHGVLLFAGKIYQKGASLGQTVAFLVVTPWNSFSFTLVLWALVGWKWTGIFVALSFVVGVLTGYVIDLVMSSRNPSEKSAPPPKYVWTGFGDFFQWKPSGSVWIYGVQYISNLFVESLIGSKMILKWLFFGILVTVFLRSILTPEHYTVFFGPDLRGLFSTLGGATILEVCSEGLLPVAADLIKIAKAPGNAFVLLLAGVVTDYTEILVLKEITGSWKKAFLLPFIAVPQVLIIGYILNSLYLVS